MELKEPTAKCQQQGEHPVTLITTSDWFKLVGHAAFTACYFPHR